MLLIIEYVGVSYSETCAAFCATDDGVILSAFCIPPQPATKAPNVMAVSVWRDEFIICS